MAKFGDYPTQDEMPAGGGVAGLIGSHQLFATLNNGSTQAFLDGLTFTATVVANAKYQIHLSTQWTIGAASDFWYPGLRVDGADIARFDVATGRTVGYTNACCLYLPSTAGSKVFTLRWEPSGVNPIILSGASTVPRSLWGLRVA